MTEPDDKLLFPATGMPDRDWWQVLWPDPAKTMRQVGVRAGLRVVDLCCGDGYFTAPMSLLVGDGEVIAVDLSEEMLSQARGEVARRGTGNVKFLEADARDLPDLVEGSVDLVVIANTFHGVPHQTALCEAAHRVLKPGGHFAVVNWYPIAREQTQVLGKPRGPRTEMRMAPESVETVAKAAGLRQVDVIKVGPFHYASIFERPPQES